MKHDITEVVNNWYNGNKKDAIALAKKMTKARFGMLLLSWRETASPENAGDPYKFLMRYTESV